MLLNLLSVITQFTISEMQIFYYLIVTLNTNYITNVHLAKAKAKAFIADYAKGGEPSNPGACKKNIKKLVILCAQLGYNIF